MDNCRQDESEQIKHYRYGCDLDSSDENVDMYVNIDGDSEWNARLLMMCDYSDAFNGQESEMHATL